jgi:hypothetical protein
MIEKFTFSAGSRVGRHDIGDGSMLIIGEPAISPDTKYVVLPDMFGGAATTVKEYVPSLKCPYPGCGGKHSMLLADFCVDGSEVGVMECSYAVEFVWVKMPKDDLVSEKQEGSKRKR